jgi:hypothetical protein
MRGTTMRKYAGATIMLLGVALLMYGLEAGDSLGGRLSTLFAGTSADRAPWLLAGGSLAVLVGVWLTCSRRDDPA